MKQITVKFIFLITALGGLLQYFMLPGIFWNLCFPLLPIVLIFYALRYKKRSTIKYSAILIALLFILELGCYLFGTERLSSPEGNQELKVLTYNLYFKNQNHKDVLQVINRSDPDILFVQELTPQWKVSLDQGLGGRYPHKSVKAMNGVMGIGIYSKYPLSNEIFLNRLDIKKPYAQVVDLQIKDTRLQLINTHLPSPAEILAHKDQLIKYTLINHQLRITQLSNLISLAKSDQEKYDAQILAGDLNTLKYEPVFKKLRMTWYNGSNHSIFSLGFTFPNIEKLPPVMTLDYIMGRGKMTFTNTQVINEGSSDHLPVESMIRI